MLVVSGVSIFLVVPTHPAGTARGAAAAYRTGDRTMRYARRTRRPTINSSSPEPACTTIDLAQFKTWQGHDAPSLARRKTMKRLVDIGNLNLAVRRTWRHLDKAQSDAVSPELDAQARNGPAEPIA